VTSDNFVRETTDVCWAVSVQAVSVQAVSVQAVSVQAVSVQAVSVQAVSVQRENESSRVSKQRKNFLTTGA